MGVNKKVTIAFSSYSDPDFDEDGDVLDEGVGNGYYEGSLEEGYEGTPRGYEFTVSIGAPSAERFRELLAESLGYINAAIS